MAVLILNKAEVHRVSSELVLPLVDKATYFTLRGAKRMVPVRTPKPFDKRPGGRLKASLRKRGPKVYLTQVKSSVGTTLRFAASVHGGAKPHIITPRFKPKLVFYWEKREVTFVGKRVSHPGVRPQSTTKFLTEPLAKAAARYGFKLRFTPTLGTSDI